MDARRRRWSTWTALRPVGGGLGPAPSAGGRLRRRRLLGDRCPQVAEHAVQRRRRLRARRGCAARRHVDQRGLPHDRPAGRDHRLRRLAAGTRLRRRAALQSLGRRGLAGLIDRDCDQAAWLDTKLRRAGIEVLNEVVLNQVVVAFASDADPGDPRATPEIRRLLVRRYALARPRGDTRQLEHLGDHQADMRPTCAPSFRRRNSGRSSSLRWTLQPHPDIRLLTCAAVGLAAVAPAFQELRPTGTPDHGLIDEYAEGVRQPHEASSKP